MLVARMSSLESEASEAKMEKGPPATAVLVGKSVGAWEIAVWRRVPGHSLSSEKHGVRGGAPRVPSEEHRRGRK